MRSIHAFVAENSANFVNLVEAADDKAFQVKLCLNSQIHFHVKCIVMRNKRTSGRADLQSMKNRRIDFRISQIIKIISDFTDDHTALNERVLNFRINDKINVTLTISCILVFKTVPFFGQGKKRLGEKLDLMGMNGNFTFSCSENKALNANNIADIPLFLEFLEQIGAHIVGADIDLDSVRRITHVDKIRLTHIAPAHNSAGNSDNVSMKSLKSGIQFFLIAVSFGNCRGFIGFVA